MAVGGGGGAGKVNVQDMSVTKWLDKSSTTLMQHCCAGRHIAEAELIVRKSGGSPVEYLRISMQDVMISSISTGASASEDRMTENVSLNFAKVAVKYIEQKADGGEGAKPDMGWNIEENTDMPHFVMA